MNAAKTGSGKSKREGKGAWRLWHESELIPNIFLIPAPLCTFRQGRGIEELCHVEISETSEVGFEARKSHT